MTHKRLVLVLLGSVAGLVCSLARATDLPEEAAAATFDPSGPTVREQILFLLREADGDGDDVVTKTEYEVCAYRVSSPYAVLDRDGDGVVTRNDLPLFLSDPTARFLRRVYEGDSDDDSRLSIEELSLLLPGEAEAVLADEDADGDGFLTIEDYPELPRNPIRRILRLLDESDLDGDGVVTQSELLAIDPTVNTDYLRRLSPTRESRIPLDAVTPPVRDPRDRLLAYLRTAHVRLGDFATRARLIEAGIRLTNEDYAALDRNRDGVLSIEDMPDSPVPVRGSSRGLLLRALVREDSDDDGLLDTSEVALAFPDAPSELVRLLDLNGDGRLDREELLSALSSQSEDNADAAYARADINYDAVVDAVDVQLAVNQALGVAVGLLPADVNGDGVIDVGDVEAVIDALLRAR